MKRHIFITLLLSSFCIPHSSFSAQPNIILILCDNLGYGDVGCFNPNASQPTPRIDRMAQQGLKFTHAYAAAPGCTPSRAALMTGCYPRRVGLDLAPGQGPVLRPVAVYGLHPDEITVAEVLICAGAVSTEVITLMDVLPTLAALSGGTKPIDRIIDGHDIRPLLFGEADARSPYDAFFYYYINQLQAVRSGLWKLYLPHEKNLTQLGAKTVDVAGHLYHLTDDPEEQNDQFAQHPDIVKRLLVHAETSRADFGDMDSPGKGVRPVGRMENPIPRLFKQ